MMGYKSERQKVGRGKGRRQQKRERRAIEASETAERMTTGVKEQK